jgi:prepilin-type N-terminal cleavage/methylation domain-containing protein/prepilin-type processing-associated H-X9-DG protein
MGAADRRGEVMIVSGSSHRGAFTLIELLVVIAIVAILSAILFPVISVAREKARQTACLSNEHQLGMAIALYTQDFNEEFPCGLGMVNGERIWAGEGWAGQCAAYVKNPDLYRCPSDLTARLDRYGWPVSYGYNINFVNVATYEDNEQNPPPGGVSLAALNSSSRTVLLFEVSGVLANATDPREGADKGGWPGRNYSASANGLDHRLYAQRDWSTLTENQYATGYLGDRLPPDSFSTQFSRASGRHSDGSVFLMGDGHAKWLRGSAVSSGLNASNADCNQDNKPAREGCEDDFHAAGTNAPSHAATFSIR